LVSDDAFSGSGFGGRGWCEDGEEISSQHRQAARVIEFLEREQPGVGGDGGAVEFELQRQSKSSRM
jgi:hypothetical protein